MRQINAYRMSGTFLAIFCAFCFSFYPPISRLLYADGASPAFLIVVNSVSRGLIYWGFCLLCKQDIRPKSDEVPFIVKTGTIQMISITFIYLSLVYLPAPVAVIIVFSHTLMLFFLLVLKGQRRMTFAALGSALMALLGLSFAIDVWDNLHALSWIGIGAALIGAVATFVRLYLFERQLKSASPAVVGAQIFMFTALLSLLFPLFLPFQPPAAASSYVWLAVLCVTMSAGNIMMFYAIARIGSFRYSMLLKLEPAFNAILSVFIVQDILGWPQYVGIAVVLASLVFFQITERTTKLHHTP